jgi:DNA-binding transcriptional LysR family regulator
VLAEKDLRSWRLVRPFDTVVDLVQEGYYMLTSPHSADKPETLHFQNWLKTEAQSTAFSFGEA